MGRHCYELRHQRSEPCANCPVAKARETGRPQSGEMVSPKGAVWSVQGVPIRDAKGNVECVVEVALDITERKQAEEALRASEATYRSIFNATNDGILVLDIETGEIVDANATFCNVFGYTPEEVRRLRLQDVSSGEAPYVQEDALRLIHQAAGGQPQRFEWLAKSRDGALLWIDVTLKRATIAGRDRVLAVGRDITERKQAEEALRESETKFRTLMETTAASVFIYRGTRPLYTNAAMERLTGYTREEILARELWQLVHPDFQSLVRERSRARQQGEQAPSRYEFKIVTKSGDERWVDFTAGIIEFEGQPAAIGTFYDITERKRAEEALRETTQTLQALVQASPLAVITVDLQGNVKMWNPAAERTFGWSEREALGHPNPIIPEDRQDEFRANLDAVLQGKLLNQVETRRRKKDGSLIDVSLSTAAMRNANGDIIGTMGIIADITERKRTEEALRKSQERYRLLADNVTDVIWTTDMDLNLTYVSPSVVRLQGYSRDEIIALPLEQIMTPSSLKTVRKALAEELAVESREQKDLSRSRTLETEELRKDGSTVWAEMKVTFLRDPDGRPAGILGVTRDITERKQAEEALRESEAEFRGVAETAAAAIFIIQGAKFRYVNPGAERLTRYGQEELLAIDFWDVVHPDHQALVRERGLARQRGEEVPSRYEFRIVTKSGEERWADMTAGAIEFEGEGAVIGTAYDITERKRAEEALRETNQTLRALVQASPLAILTMDLQGNVRTWNPAAERIFGWSEQEAVGRPNPIIPEDRQNEFRALLDAVLHGNLYSKAETLRGRKDGSLIDVSLSTAAMRNAMGDIIGVMSMLDDITERKRAEEALQKAREELEARVDRQMEIGESLWPNLP